ncbi:site-specific integrase [Polyangium sp. 15x6]|uniref:tyrosine-type recombinase/integrase n=1 Tax=Polyangium sp. 15x6 TaxID=3042687 RepID=UPI00249A289D|nr:site-specific integrase [Polyangium sp. 15x6]MDI3285148.1 site-specific integrase [Polyangium sp. 15x6]
MSRLSKESAATVRGRLNRVAHFFRPGATAATFPWHELRYEDIQRLRGHLADAGAPTTANTTLSFVRETLRTAWRLGLLDAEELERVLDVERVRGESLPAGRALALHEVRALINAAGKDVRRWRARRDAALVVILYCAGIRRFEAAQLQVEEVEDDNGRLWLIVRGKGNKKRRVPLPRDARAVVDAWLKTLGRATGPLFPAGARRGRRLAGKSMRKENVGKIIKRLVERAALDHASPHDFRRTFISNLLDESGDVGAIQKLAGHADVTTTLRYDRRGERAKVAAVDKLPLPFGGP